MMAQGMGELFLRIACPMLEANAISLAATSLKRVPPYREPLSYKQVLESPSQQPLKNERFLCPIF
jgi:hypothetical protein